MPSASAPVNVPIGPDTHPVAPVEGELPPVLALPPAALLPPVLTAPPTAFDPPVAAEPPTALDPVLAEPPLALEPPLVVAPPLVVRPVAFEPPAVVTAAALVPPLLVVPSLVSPPALRVLPLDGAPPAVEASLAVARLPPLGATPLLDEVPPRVPDPGATTDEPPTVAAPPVAPLVEFSFELEHPPPESAVRIPVARRVKTAEDDGFDVSRTANAPSIESGFELPLSRASPARNNRDDHRRKKALDNSAARSIGHGRKVKSGWTARFDRLLVYATVLFRARRSVEDAILVKRLFRAAKTK